ncbi:flagellar biosynthesis protein FlhA [Cysteiniphilum litorale]|uniref:flagellar biosynthesis protein FlhA n=1 Tax=Cysteiniphilum litorale TaxID=2056700 RepID=UPI003F8849E9
MIAKTNNWQLLFGKRSELMFVVMIIGILLVLFMPIPAFLLDLLLILNLSFALVLFLLTFYIDKPLSFSTFPSLLLIATLFRLALNISATRLILTHAEAGKVIEAIGTYVIQGNYIVGLVVFLILIVVQFIVVTNGAQRVAEVAARFTLDSLPGKQMSIDAEMNLGLIDHNTARKRRQALEKETNFYGAMDGASKFVKGDAIAGIIIILIDIIAGLTIGLSQHAMSWSGALHTYTLLTVGDGIITQIPALIISTATGVIVTRAATDAELGQEVSRQISAYPKILVMVSIGLFVLMLLPGIPGLPVFIVLALLVFLSYLTIKRFKAGENNTDNSNTTDNDSKTPHRDVESVLVVHPIAINLHSQLQAIIGSKHELLKSRIDQFRIKYAQEIGFILPSVHIAFSNTLKENHYEITFNEIKVGEGLLMPQHQLAINAHNAPIQLAGIATVDPTYQLPAIWVDENAVDKAKAQKLTVVSSLNVLMTHFSQKVRLHTAELLTRQALEARLHTLKSTHENLIDEAIPEVINLSVLQQILKQLLKEQVPIRQLATILEVIIDEGKAQNQPAHLIEKIRQRLANTICYQLMKEHKELHVLTLAPQLEQSFHQALSENNFQTLVLAPTVIERFSKSLLKQVETMLAHNHPPVLLTNTPLRRHLRLITERIFQQLTILSIDEIPQHVALKSFATVTGESNA